MSSVVVSKSSQSPSKAQFIVSLSSASVASSTVSINLEKEVLNVDVPRNFGCSYVIRMVGFATDDVNILDGKLPLAYVSAKLLDASCIFPLLFNTPPSSVDIALSVDMGLNHSSLSVLTLSLEGRNVGVDNTVVQLVFDVSIE